ncbi:hypothetical protein [Pricia antarctica]|nr:hypothetical protein [Pricia antarctica]
MKLHYLIIPILLSLSIQCYGQKTRAELIFKDSTVMKGYAEPTNVNNIRFRKEKRAKKQFFSFEEVDTLKVYYDFEPTIFVLVKIKDKTVPEVLEMAHTGKNVTYFREVSQGYSAPIMTPTGGGGFLMTGGGAYNTIYSYLRKPNEEEALYLGSSYWLTKNFKKTASDFFSDCPSLVKKITDKEMKKRDLKEIINYYNSVCE